MSNKSPDSKTKPEKKFISKEKLHQFGISKKGESINDVFTRVSKAITKTELDSKFSNSEELKDFQEKITTLMKDQKFIPSTTILMNAGRFNKIPLSACAVPPVDLQKDLNEVKKSVDDFHFSGMGTGFNFDDIENPIETINYLNQLGIDGQNNKKQLRPVGNMGILSIDHPKILEYIELKKADRHKEWVFNFSVTINDKNLEKIKNKESITLKNNKKIDSDKLLSAISEVIHTTGDPGLIYIDRLNNDNQVPTAGNYQSLAPCGEVGLAAGETCQFSYLNLGEFVENGEINYQELERVVILVTRFLDDVVEYNISRYSNETSKKVTEDKRKIGIGVCGLADLLKKLDIEYSSDESFNLVENLFSYINYVSKKTSIDLAKQRGSFGKFDESKYVSEDNIIKNYSHKATDTVSKDQWIELEKNIKLNGIRNCATITLPPTGRSSLLINASQSIEPYFKDIVSISTKKQLLMVTKIQKFVDESISKTVNIPSHSSPEEIKEVIKMSISLGLKGITLYRDKSRLNQPTKL